MARPPEWPGMVSGWLVTLLWPLVGMLVGVGATLITASPELIGTAFVGATAIVAAIPLWKRAHWRAYRRSRCRNPYLCPQCSANVYQSPHQCPACGVRLLWGEEE